MIALPVRDPGPMSRLRDVMADPTAPSEVFRLLTERKSLPWIANAWAVPKGRFFEWFTTTHADLYDAALKVVAADLALEALEISDAPPRQVLDDAGEPVFNEDGTPAISPAEVNRDKLRVDTRFKLAAKLDRLRFGETVRVERSVTFAADAGLVGTMGALLQLVSSRAPVAPAERLIAPEQAPDAIGADTAISVLEPARVVVDGAARADDGII